MSSTNKEKTDKKKNPQMKMVIGMVQNSFRLINELIEKVSGLSDKMEKLISVVEETSGDSGSKKTKTLDTLSQLLLTSTAYNINESILRPPPVATPTYIPAQIQPQAGAPVAPQAAGNVQAPQYEGGPPEPAPSDEPSLIKPSKLFKKLKNQ